MKKFILLIFLCINIVYITRADSPCSSITGNIFRRIAAGPRPGIYQVSLDNNCALRVPDFRSSYIARVTKLGWRVDSVRQSPEIGSTIFPLSAGTCPDGIRRLLILKAYFRNTRTTLNPRDDQFCEMTIVDTMILVDRLAPTARSISISTTDLVFEPGHLKSHFGSSAISDNCTSLSVLQDNIEFASSPPFPSFVELFCESARNTYRVRYRTKDHCGNHSSWAWATISFRETIEPIVAGLTGPTELVVDNTCRTLITRSQFSFVAVDDHTSSDRIQISYRVIAPISLSGNISAGGKIVNAHGICPPDNIIKVRICAQDCLGNGNLHLSDNLVTSNCQTIDITIKDTRPPIMDLFLAPVNLPVNITTCTALMPNLTSLAPGFVRGFDECSDVSIYQLPGPGSVLNNGMPRAPSLASGVPRTFDCEFLKEPDTAINCTNFSGVFKSISVSFLAVDCYGNCSITRVEGLVLLTTIPSPFDLSGVYYEGKGPITRKVMEPSTLNMNNYPNPFKLATQIQFTGEAESHGEFRFYNIQGQEILRKSVNVYKGLNTVQMDKNDLNHTGMIYYTLETTNKITGGITRAQNKMMIFD